MRVSSTKLRRLAQAYSSSIPKPNSDFPRNAVLSQGRCPGHEAFALCGFLPPRDWAQASSSSPQNISQRMLCLHRGFGLERTALRRCFLGKASVASGKKSCGRAGASWALLYRAPCSRPRFTLPGRTKQTQPQPCSSVHSLGWHSMHTTISQCRHHLSFYSGAQAESRSRPDQLRQTVAALRLDSEFPKNAVLSQTGCQGKECFALCGFLPSCWEY